MDLGDGPGDSWKFGRRGREGRAILSRISRSGGRRRRERAADVTARRSGKPSGKASGSRHRRTGPASRPHHPRRPPNAPGSAPAQRPASRDSDGAMIMSINIISIHIILYALPQPHRRTRPPRRRSSAPGKPHGDLGAPPGREVTAAPRMVIAPRRPLHGGRPLGAAGPAPVSRRRRRGAVPGVRLRRVSGLALLPRSSARRSGRGGLAGALDPRRTALPARDRSLVRQCVAELARSSGSAPVARRERLQLAHDARGPPRRGRAPLRSCGGGVRGAAAPTRIPRRRFPGVQLPRTGGSLRALGRHAALLGTRGALRDRPR